jgi:hypothetical protein
VQIEPGVEVRGGDSSAARRQNQLASS